MRVFWKSIPHTRQIVEWKVVCWDNCLEFEIKMSRWFLSVWRSWSDVLTSCRLRVLAKDSGRGLMRKRGINCKFKNAISGCNGRIHELLNRGSCRMGGHADLQNKGSCRMVIIFSFTDYSLTAIFCLMKRQFKLAGLVQLQICIHSSTSTTYTVNCTQWGVLNFITLLNCKSVSSLGILKQRPAKSKTLTKS